MAWLTKSTNLVTVITGAGDISQAVSTPVPVANRTLAYWALESGLRPHELKIDRSRPVKLKLRVHTTTGTVPGLA